MLINSRWDQCAICQSLSREYQNECEQEAIAVMRQRGTLPPPTPAADHDNVGEIIASRKHQAHVIRRLESHRALAHRRSPSRAAMSY